MPCRSADAIDEAIITILTLPKDNGLDFFFKCLKGRCKSVLRNPKATKTFRDTLERTELLPLP